MTACAYLKTNKTTTDVMLPCVMLFQLAGEYLKSGGSPTKVAAMLRQE